jgi:hypothetical protein
MSGMKDNRQAINTVGSPLAPKDASGRQGYALPMALMAAARFLPAAVRGFRAARAYTPFSQNLGTVGRLKDIFTPKKGLGLQMGKAGEGAGFRVGSLIRSNPILAASAPSLAYDAGRIGGPAAGEGLKAVANFLVPGTRFDPFKDKKEDLKTTDDGTGIKRGSKNVGDTSVTGTTKPGEAGGATVKSDAEKQQINEARIQETKDKYYKLMGLDKMKKDAVYDSLIDASKIVSEEGADLKGSIKSGTLQNRIIQAISGQLDKSAALKKQIDAAVLKGEIEKDINKTKLTSFQEQIKFIKENPNDPLAKKLSGATSVADNLAALADKPITSDIVQRLVESKGQAVKGQVRDDKYQKWEKNNEGKDEIDYLQDVYKGQTLDAGIYIINKKAIRIDEGGNAFPVDLDSIIG